ARCYNRRQPDHPVRRQRQRHERSRSVRQGRHRRRPRRRRVTGSIRVFEHIRRCILTLRSGRNESMLQSIILILHVLTCLMIVGLVLLQRGKGADAGTGFGAGASGTVFGARGSASFLSRATAALATTFFVTSLALAFF